MLGMRVRVEKGVKEPQHHTGEIVDGGLVRCDGCAAKKPMVGKLPLAHAMPGGTDWGRAYFEKHRCVARSRAPKCSGRDWGE